MNEHFELPPLRLLAQLAPSLATGADGAAAVLGRVRSFEHCPLAVLLTALFEAPVSVGTSTWTCWDGGVHGVPLPEDYRRVAAAIDTNWRGVGAPVRLDEFLDAVAASTAGAA